MTHAVCSFNFEGLVPREPEAINQIGVNNNLTSVLRAAQLAPQSPNGASKGGGDSFQTGSTELNVQVTPSQLGSPEFQKKLAEYSSAGIRVHVEMVPEGTKVVALRGLNEPEPQAPPAAAATSTPPAPAAAPAAPLTTAQKTAEAAVLTAGTGCALAVGLGSALLGAAGAAVLSSTMTLGAGAAVEMLAHGGAIGALGATLAAGGVLAKVQILTAALATGVGGGAIGFSLGKVLGKVLALVPAGLLGGTKGGLAVLSAGGDKKPPKSVRPNGFTGLGVAVGMMSGAAGGFLGGAGLVAAGTPFAQTLSLAHLGTPGIVAGGLGALALGVAGALGAKTVVDHASRTAAALHAKSSATP